MLKIAVYGKGGIGKSTTVSNMAVALAEKGLSAVSYTHLDVYKRQGGRTGRDSGQTLLYVCTYKRRPKTTDGTCKAVLIFTA